MSSLTHNLVMRHESWHVRWYRYWLSLGGSPAGYKENFCRYVRILLIWAPLRWFFKGRIKGVPTWLAAIVASVLAFIGVAFYIWPHIALRILWQTAAAIGILLGFVGIIVLGVYLYDRDPKKALTAAKWTTCPLWIVPYLVLLAGLWIWDTFEDQLRAFGKFVQRRVFFGVNPFLASVLILWTGLLTLWFYEHPVRTAIIVGSVIVGLGMIVLGVYLVEEIKERRYRGRHRTKSKSRVGRMYEGTADTVKLAYTYVDAKKKGSRICPFIEFDDEHSQAA